MHDPINVKYYVKILHSMQEPIESKFKRQAKKKASTTVSFISQFLLGADNPADIAVDIGDRVTKLPHLHIGSSVTAGFSIAGLVMSALDFIRVPLVYLICFLMKKPVPFTLNNNARWLYSGILLGLAITALAVTSIAPIIGFVGAGIALTSGLYLLGKTVWNRFKLGEKKNKLAKDIDQEIVLINKLQQEAKTLQDALFEATNQEQLAELVSKIDDLHDRYITQKEKINDLKNKKLDIEEKIKTTFPSQIQHEQQEPVRQPLQPQVQILITHPRFGKNN